MPTLPTPLARRSQDTPSTRSPPDAHRICRDSWNRCLLDRTIRVLHAFESLPYIVAAVLSCAGTNLDTCWAQPAAPSGCGWPHVDHFVRNASSASHAASYRHVDRLDVLIAAPAAFVTGGLCCSRCGLFRPETNRGATLGLFALAWRVAGFFVAIFAAFAPSTSACSGTSSTGSCQRRRAAESFSLRLVE